MGAIRKLEVNGWDLVVGEDDVPRVRDLDLGKRLGYERPRKFRELVERLRRDGILNDIDCRPTVGRQLVPASGSFRDVTEYHLTERGALKAIVKSETPKAVEITGQVIDVYLAAREASRPAPSVVVPMSEVHGTRVGDTYARAEVAKWCRLAALEQGTTIHRVHGALRRQYKVPSVYALAVSVWPTARRFLEDLAGNQLRLAHSRQMPLPWGSRG